MKITFQVDHAHCFRNCIEAPRGLTTIDVDPKKLSTHHRDLIADKMPDGGSMVCFASGKIATAKRPTVESLIESLIEDRKKSVTKILGKDAKILKNPW